MPELEDFDEENGDEDSYDEEKEPPQHEVEETSRTLKSSTKVSSKVFRADDTAEAQLELVFRGGQDWTRWLQTICLECTLDGKNIGNAAGRYVKRGWIRNHFWESMEAPFIRTCPCCFRFV